MSLTIVFRPEAELQEAYQWYESQRKGLGEDFLLCIEAAISSIQRSPEMYPIVYNKEAISMKCHVCGSKMRSMITNLPFKMSETTIVILKDLPVFQCDSCSEYLLDDPVLKDVERILEKVNAAAELEVIKYAA